MQFPTFDGAQLEAVGRAEREAVALVRGWYVLAPRELDHLRYEVLTLAELDDDGVIDGVFAHVRCYGRRTAPGPAQDVYQICLQDHVILERAAEALLEPLLLYVLTHELVHVVRFGCELQRVDLPVDQRAAEEAAVDRTARRILRQAGRPDLGPVLERFRLAHLGLAGPAARPETLRSR